MDNSTNNVSAEPAIRLALRHACGLPTLLLFASMLGFGSLVRASDFSLTYALAATALIWGLPAQVALVELQALGANALAVLVAAAMANVRFLPMAVAFMPLLEVAGKLPAKQRYTAVHLLSVSSWAMSLKAFNDLPTPLRYPYFVTFGTALMIAGLLGTALGYVSTGALPDAVALALLFLNPLFFALLFAGSRERSVVLALLAGGILGPPLTWLSPDWGLLLTGLVAGTGAFWLNEAWQRRGWFRRRG